MTVAELAAKLQEMPQDAEVVYEGGGAQIFPVAGVSELPDWVQDSQERWLDGQYPDGWVMLE